MGRAAEIVRSHCEGIIGLTPKRTSRFSAAIAAGLQRFARGLGLGVGATAYFPGVARPDAARHRRLAQRRSETAHLSACACGAANAMNAPACWKCEAPLPPTSYDDAALPAEASARAPVAPLAPAPGHAAASAPPSPSAPPSSRFGAPASRRRRQAALILLAVVALGVASTGLRAPPAAEREAAAKNAAHDRSGTRSDVAPATGPASKARLGGLSGTARRQ